MLKRALTLSFSATLARMLSLILINKFMSVIVGPSGLAIIGQFQNFSSIIMSVAQVGTSQGIVKLCAEYQAGHSSNKLDDLFSTTFKLIFLVSILISIVLSSFSVAFSKYLLGDVSYWYIFCIYALTIPLFSINATLLSIINGLGYLKYWAQIIIIQSTYAMIITCFLIGLLELEGALIALVTNQSVVLFVTLRKMRKIGAVRWEHVTRKFSNHQFRRLLNFSLMSLTSAICVPLSFMIIRNEITNSFGLTSAGHWQALWYVSSTSVMVISMTLGTYYLPKLSSLMTKREVTKEIIHASSLILPLSGIIFFLIYLLKENVVVLLFSKEFLPMLSLFKWQLMGDFLKVASFLIGYVTLAKAMTKTYIALEICGSISLVLLSVFFMSEFGLVGVTYAHCINYFIYLVVISIIYSRSKFA